MRKIILASCFLLSILAFHACSSDNKEGQRSDTFNTVAVIEKKSIQTDSGRIDIETVQGNAEGKAVLVNSDGKIVGRGMMRGNVPVGAWMKYDKDGKLISAEHFSEGKKLQQLDITDFDFKEFTNEKFGARFKVPKSWKENSPTNQSLIFSFEKEVKADTIHIKPNFSLVKAKLQKGEDLQSIADLQMEMMHKSYSRVQTIQENNIVVDSCLSFQRYGFYDDGNDRVGFLNVIIVSGVDIWIISCEAQNNSQGEFLKYQGVFQEIVESFHRIK